MRPCVIASCLFAVGLGLHAGPQSESPVDQAREGLRKATDNLASVRRAETHPAASAPVKPADQGALRQAEAEVIRCINELAATTADQSTPQIDLANLPAVIPTESRAQDDAAVTPPLPTPPSLSGTPEMETQVTYLLRLANVVFCGRVSQELIDHTWQITPLETWLKPDDIPRIRPIFVNIPELQQGEEVLVFFQNYTNTETVGTGQGAANEHAFVLRLQGQAKQEIKKRVQTNVKLDPPAKPNKPAVPQAPKTL